MAGGHAQSGGHARLIIRLSTLFAPTLREVPADAELASHQLMLRAGLMRRVGDAAGMYALLPLGVRVKAKVEAIIREEMNACGGQECQFPLVQPAELWRESGRWLVYGDEMWRLTDRHGREYCLGPTHEEVFTDLIRTHVSSWRQLPLLLYQIQNKYRDERRPRFGMLRAREFIMKDGYSFHRDEADLTAWYERLYGAYARIFARCGLDCRAVLADPGAIGGSRTHEFMALAQAGEAEIVSCVACDYAADIEQAETALRPPPAEGPLLRRATPGARTVAEVAAVLDVPAGAVAKTLFYVVTDAAGAERLVAAVVPGDRELNELKLANATGAARLRPAQPEEVPVPLGSAGPVDLAGAEIWVDRVVAQGGSWVVGANVAGYHLAGAAPGRDFPATAAACLTLAAAGDACPQCGAEVVLSRGIEVGQVFGLGTKYSKALGASFLDDSGENHPMVMGCYGIGVTRTMAAIVEQFHDDAGISWPTAVAPYHCVLVPVGAGQAGAAAMAAAEQLAAALDLAGVDVVVDDRDERPGVKFKDADLIGFPVRVTLGRALASGEVEVRLRRSGVVRLVPLQDTVQAVQEMLA